MDTKSEGVTRTERIKSYFCGVVHELELEVSLEI